LNIHGDVYRVDCVDSDHFIAATLNNEIIDINNTYSDRFEDKWQEAQTDRDIVLFYILSQIIYPDFDTPRPEKFESPYALVDKHDVILLRWQGGKAIGFYTVKPTGNCGHRKIKYRKLVECSNGDFRYGSILDEREIRNARGRHGVHQIGV